MVRLSNFIIETKTNVEYAPESQKTTFTTVRGEIKSIDLSAVFFLQDVQTASAHAGTAVNVFSAGEVSVEPDGASGGKRITFTPGETGFTEIMNAAGGSMTINDGTSSRVLTFSFSSGADNVLHTSSGSGPFGDGQGSDVGEAALVTAINGTSGGEVAITASSVADSSANIVVDLVHDSGGTINISFTQGGANNIGSDFLVVTDIAGAPSQDRLEATVNFSQRTTG